LTCSPLSSASFSLLADAAVDQGYDFMAQAVGGLMHITGAADGPPQKVGVAITDVMTGVLTAGAVCVPRTH
jgi:crotonobetainyl-CoA:carnitine CoA-transferase CaiB-like acyl-CoA transferase